MRKKSNRDKIIKGKIDHIKCEICGENATHSIVLNLREKPGPPLEKDNVIRTVCEKDSIGLFNDHVPYWQWDGLRKQYRQRGILLAKEYCDIQIVKLENV